MIDFKIYSFGHFGHFGRPKPSFVPGISGMPETLPETSMHETLPTLVHTFRMIHLPFPSELHPPSSEDVAPLDPSVPQTANASICDAIQLAKRSLLGHTRTLTKAIMSTQTPPMPIPVAPLTSHYHISVLRGIE